MLKLLTKKEEITTKLLEKLKKKATTLWYTLDWLL